MIHVEQVEFAYARGGFQLRVPDLRVARGERVAVVGPSGSGKSTLLRLLGGILVPARGTVRVADTAVGSLPERARRAFRATRIGYVFQEFELLDYLDVLDNILLPYRLTGALRLDTAARDNARALLASVGLAGFESRALASLSHGERQRVAVCRALVASPAVVLADEPTGSLDPDSKVAALELLFERTRSLDATLLVVTHDHAHLDRFDRVVPFRAGAPA
ncbi:MAG: ATP-binding cassette domain-containing protein [Candidatus Sumerlaeia bacterium]|nr:ATP-binding cassette domain-containing protein [Candidatus Sumerlaeia bacterium]